MKFDIYLHEAPLSVLSEKGSYGDASLGIKYCSINSIGNNTYEYT